MITETIADDKVAEIVDKELREELSEFGFQRAEITAAWDRDGQEYLSIRSYLDPKRPLDPRRSSLARSKLRYALLGAGEDRFPSVVQIFPDVP